MVAAITYPERVGKFVMGGSHIGTGGDRYLMANRPSEGSRATRQALDDPSRENIAHYLRVHIDDESLVTDELVDYIHRAHTWSPEFIEARRQSMSLPHDYTPDLAGIQAPVLLIHGRYDRMVPFEVSSRSSTTSPTRASCCSTIAATGRPSRSRPSGPRRSSRSSRAIEWVPTQGAASSPLSASAGVRSRRRLRRWIAIKAAEAEQRGEDQVIAR